MRELPRVIAYYDCTIREMRCDNFYCGQRHRNPNVHQHEIDGAVDFRKRLSKVTLAELDEAAQTRSCEILCAATVLLGSYSVPITAPEPPNSATLSRTAAAR